MRLGALLLALWALVLGTGCDEVVPTTQVLFVVDLDATVAALADDVLLEASGSARRIVLRGEGAVALPFSFSLVPADGEEEGEVRVRARQGGEVLVERRVQLAFRPYRTVSLGVVLSDPCRTTSCDEDETCIDCGECGPVLVTPEQLEPLVHASDAVAHWAERLRCDSPDAGP